MRFNKKEIELLEQLSSAYIKAKGLVSKAEEIDKNSGANIQINKEFRDAFSHIARILGDQLLSEGGKRKSDSMYYITNIEKAIGHIYRAGYDALDGISISLREKINTLSDFPASTITQALPNYAEKIGKLNSFHDYLVKLKANKDIGSGSSEDFNKCIRKMEKIKSSMLDMNEAIPLIREIQQEKDKDKKFTWFQMIVGVISGTILGYLISYILFPG